MARIREAQGDLDGALDLLDEAERLYVSDFFPNVRPVAALKARVWVAQGGWGKPSIGRVSRDCLLRTTSATCASSSTSPWPGCSWPDIKSDREDRSILEAMGLLERLLQAAEEGGRMGSVIEILMLQALAHKCKATSRLRSRRCNRPWRWPSRRATSASSWTKARPWRQLLREAAARGIVPAYTSQAAGRIGSRAAGERR